MNLHSELIEKQSNQFFPQSLDAPEINLKKVSSVRLDVSLRVGFLLVTLVTVLMTALVVHFPWRWVVYKNSDEFVQQLNHEVISSLSREFNDTLAMVMGHQRLLGDLWKSGTIDLRNQVEREAMLLPILNASRYYSFVGIGLNNGDYYGAQRRSAGSIALIDSAWSHKAGRALRHERLFVYDGQEYSFVRENTRVNEYNAVQRAWFRQALQHDNQAVLTQAYTFSSTGRPGVNAALQIRSKDHLNLGVVTIALELDRLSDFMSHLRVGKSGTVFMVDQEGRILASKAPVDLKQEIMHKDEEDELLFLPTIHNANAPLIRVASRALKENGLVDIKSLAQNWTVRALVEGKIYSVSAQAIGRNNWFLFTVIPTEDFAERVNQNTAMVILFVVIMIVFGCLSAMALGHYGIIKPLTEIIKQTHFVSNYDLSKISLVNSRIREIHTLSGALVYMASGLYSFGKYLPTELVKKLLRSGVVAKPYGENRTVSIMFADLVGFTSITEELGPKIVPYLDQYFETMSDQIENQLGTIDKFIGDCVMAFWGAPFYYEEHPVRACAAALDCLAKLEELRKHWPEKWADALNMRIGVNTGRVVVGNIGSKSRINYTVVGDPVNLASRFEGGCKKYGVRCIIGQSTYELAKYDIVARRLDVTFFKGKSQPVVIYELIAMRESTYKASDYAWIEIYDKALTAFLASDLTTAKSYFELTIQMRGGDSASSYFLQQCNDQGN